MTTPGTLWHFRFFFLTFSRSDEGGLDLPDKGIMDVEGVVDVLEEDDSLNQQVVYASVCDAPDDDPTMKRYEDLPEYTMDLRRLKTIYDNGDERMAMSLLHKRVNLRIDASERARMDDGRYAYSCSKAYLDFLMIVGDGMGLHMFIPQSVGNTGFELTLRIDLQVKEFHVKHGNLGFDPTGCMMCVAIMDNEDLWIGMAPPTYFEDVESTFDMNQRHGDTRLSLAHHRQMVAYILKIVQELPDMSIYVTNPYAVNLGEGPHGLYTNAL